MQTDLVSGIKLCVLTLVRNYEHNAISKATPIPRFDYITKNDCYSNNCIIFNQPNQNKIKRTLK